MLTVNPSTEPPARTEALLEASRGVTVPTLIIRAGQSDVIDEDGLAEMRDLVPQTEVFDVPGAGHMVAGDKNDAFNAGVTSFLRQHFPSA